MPEVEREICTDCEPPANAPAIDDPLPAVPRLSRRGFAHKAFKVLGGGALAVGAVSLLGVDPREAEAYTCTCGVYYTGQWSCEYCTNGIRSGRVSFFYRGNLRISPTGCGAQCNYWGPWHCDQSACPGHGCGLC